MKKQFNSIALLAVASASLFVSCSKDTDLYDSNLAQKEYEQKWVERFGEVAADQDWNLATQVTATMSITEDALAKYNLQLFTANPLYDEDALLIADYEVETDANGYATVTFKCDVAKSATQLYAVRKDSHNRRLVKLADISNGTIDVSFGGASTKAGTRAANTNENNDYEILLYNPPYTSESDVASKLANYTKGVDINSNYNGQLDDFYDLTGAENLAIEISTTQKLGYFYYGNHTKLKKFVMVIKKGGVLDFNGQNNIYTNGGEIDVEIIVESGGTLYMNTSFGELGLVRLSVLPGGKVTGNVLKTGAAQGSSTTTDGLYNAGTIEVTSLYLANGNVHNNGVVKVKNIETPNGGTFYNNGRVECETVGANSDNWSTSFIKTNCLFRCTNSIRTGGVTVGSNAALEAKTMQIGGKIELNENSILRASEQILLGGAPIYGPNTRGKSALLTTPTIGYFSSENGSYSQITGNVYLEFNKIVKAGSDSNSEGESYWSNIIDNLIANNYKMGYTSARSNVGNAPITISGDDSDVNIENASCTGKGNTPKEETKPTTNANYWIIACEDLGSTDDYDFNDVVVKIAYVSGSNEVEITPLAAGGTLKSEIYFKDKDGNENRIGEIHQLFGGTQGADGLYSVVNANGSGTIFDKSNAQTAQSVNYGVEGFSLSNDTSGATNMGGFFIKVTKDESTGDAVTINAPDHEGQVPQMFCVDSGWSWPTEGTSIEVAYPGFKTWTGNTNYTQWITQAAE